MSIFRFKQFEVDQTSCAMKINTDGVLLGALAGANHPETILDVGTGKGVIALMMAQRFPNAKIDALEIDPLCADTAGKNFKNSSFSDCLTIYKASFQNFLDANPEKRYDLIISNPPFFIDSLKPTDPEMERAKHTDKSFFAELAHYVSMHLSSNGTFWVILPHTTADLLKDIMQGTNVGLANTTTIHSFIDSDPHRELLAFNKRGSYENFEKFVIYHTKKEYSSQYKKAMRSFLTIF